MAITIAPRSQVRYVGGGRFSGNQEFPNGATLNIGAEGVVHAVPGVNAELGCTFGMLKVSLNVADIQPIGFPPLVATTFAKFRSSRKPIC